MDYAKEATELGLELIDELILKVTPDDIIEKASELVAMAVDMEVSGSEKFEWVLEQIKPLLSYVIRFVGERLVQLMYELMMEKANG